MIPDYLQHLRGAEAVDEDILCHLWHVAAVCGFVKYNVDIRQRRAHGLVILNIATVKLGCWVDPFWFAVLVSLWLEIVDYADGPAFAQKQINNVRAD